MTTAFDVSQQRDRDERRPYNPQIDGGLAAMRRAAYRARKRAIALDGYVAPGAMAKSCTTPRPS